jgi:hypothetical protein
MTGRTRQCPEVVRAGRLKKAIEFHDAAVLVEDVAPNADAICCSRLGAHAAGESHNEAIALLEKAEPKVAKHLRALLNLKSKVAYTHHPVTTDDHKKANRAASNLVEAARRIARPATGKGG